jgi:polysaccharide export outer membrane protein
MRKSLLIESVLLLVSIVVPAVAVQAQTPLVSPAAPSSPPPVSISPAMPVVASPPTDPAKLAGMAGSAKPAGFDESPSYVLGAGDEISVSIWGVPGFDANYTISPDGKISMRLIGEIQAAGLTRQQLQDAINKAALKELRTPRSSVNLLASHSKHIYFDGDGIGPGAMDLVMPIHLLEALSTHGCCKDFANKNRIEILRDGKPLVHDAGGKKTEYFKYTDLTSGKHPESNPLLLDGDHIIVP